MAMVMPHEQNKIVLIYNKIEETQIVIDAICVSFFERLF